ncbi:hypothetical protein C8Q75DRAFT_731285 [Abortiporus biennis]|nr:hypothetical protein C8Q75DRAFT_731285 [Abortiporus biennis]
MRDPPDLLKLVSEEVDSEGLAQFRNEEDEFAGDEDEFYWKEPTVEELTVVAMAEINNISAIQKTAPMLSKVVLKTCQPSKAKSVGASEYHPKSFMADAMSAKLREPPADSEEWPNIWLCLDNIQLYAQCRDQHIRMVNEMIKETAATAIYMKDCPTNAFNLEAVEKLLNKGEHCNVTAKKILKDIDRDPSRLSNTDEVTTQGMKATLKDFMAQLSITAESPLRKILVVSDDGKSYETLGKLKAELSGIDDEFLSLSFIHEIIEFWHTKWTDLSQICDNL